MAKSGRRPPGDLRNTLGSLMQSALEQMGVVREVVERGAQAQRTRYDSVRLDRRRRDALAALGEVIHRLAVRGHLGELGEEPEVRAQLEQIDDVDQRLEAAGERGSSGFAVNSGWKRGSQTGRPHPGDDGEVPVWRPVPPFAAPHPGDAPDDEPAPPPDERSHEPPSLSGGGIRFGDDWDDDDLEEYMCDDDVPVAASAEAQPAPEAETKAKAKPKPKPKPKPKTAAKAETAAAAVAAPKPRKRRSKKGQEK